MKLWTLKKMCLVEVFDRECLSYNYQFRVFNTPFWKHIRVVFSFWVIMLKSTYRTTHKFLYSLSCMTFFCFFFRLRLLHESTMVVCFFLSSLFFNFAILVLICWSSSSKSNKIHLNLIPTKKKKSRATKCQTQKTKSI